MSEHIQPSPPLGVGRAEAVTAADFADFFRGVHGFDPYPWQTRLSRQVVNTGRWPELVDLPTGAGKTALIDIAVFAIAAKPETMPRRVVFVINRRTVVDQVYEHVMKLQSALEDPGDPAMRRVAGRLAEVCGGASINGIKLRGGTCHHGRWADRPDTVWVTVSTVDQFGSKLLFRAYGTGPKNRPVLAGLAGSDCLVILDEAHLDKPFAQTVRRVSDGQPETAGLPRRYHIVEMSATLARAASSRQAGQATDPSRFGLTDDDLSCAELARRVCTPKSAHLRKVPDWVEPHEAIPAAVCEILEGLDDSERTVGVVVNRVRTARETHRVLTEAGWTAHLLTGRMRPLDCDESTAAVQAAVDPARDTDTAERTVVVATQCIEAGADYSFDALVTEVAPVDSLRQRLGRLDRRGRLSERTGEPARAWILGPAKPADAVSFKKDPVYGGAVEATWKQLLQATAQGKKPLRAAPLAPCKFPGAESAAELPETVSAVKSAKAVSVGEAPLCGDALARCRECEFPETAFTVKPNAPMLLPHHMDAWAQTNPEPAQALPIDRFLHGMLTDEDARRPADVSMVWRYDWSRAVLQEVPIRTAESLQVPWRAAVAWLKGAAEAEVADAGNEIVRSRSGNGGNSGMPVQERDWWVRWVGHDAPPEPITPDDIQPGDTLMVDPARGGLYHGTWSPSSYEPVTDLGDAAQHAYQKRFTLRLDRRLAPDWPHPPRPSDDSDESDDERIDEWLESVAVEVTADPAQPDWMLKTLEKVAAPGRRKRPVGVGEDEYFIVSAGANTEADTMDGSDESQSVTGTGVPLRDHLAGVGARARDYAERLGLSPNVCSDIELAARLHDIGKADTRFQRQIVGGDEVRLIRLDEPLAKSMPGTRANPKRWPAVYHELLSVMMASGSDGMRSAGDPDLVLHLIGNHHGRARSLPLLRCDEDPQIVEYSDGCHTYEAHTADAGPELANEMAERFWRLARRYGHHGLAWMEAIMRQADQQHSAHERNTR